MKFGFKTPSIKKSISARTTEKINRTVKSSFTPFYGKKGMSFLNNPKKSIYNKIYNKTTTSVFDNIKSKDTSNNNISESHNCFTGIKDILINNLKNCTPLQAMI